jgi:hypothetical protein
MCNVASGTVIVALALAVQPGLDSPWEQGVSGRLQRKVIVMRVFLTIGPRVRIREATDGLSLNLNVVEF